MHGSAATHRKDPRAILAEIAADLAVLLPFILIDFAAQLVDRALGMAYGTISSTLLTGGG